MKRVLWFLAAVLIACAAAPAPRAEAPRTSRAPVVHEVSLTYADLDAAETFFRDVLGAEVVGRRTALDAILGAAFSSEANTERVHVRFGTENVELVKVEGAAPHPYREDAHSNDEDFQHLALVTRDMDAAYARVRAAVRPISPEPQRIPDSNPNAGGIRAYYFRDAEGHPLELIWYPEGRGDPRWQSASGDGPIVGIDHTAIAVRDTDASVRFYSEGLGLSVAGSGENVGIEQEHLSGVEGARVRITGLRGASGVGVELLQYLEPGPGRDRDDDPIGASTQWETTIGVDDLAAARERLRAIGVEAPEPTLCTLGGGGRVVGFLVRDPDGHFVRVVGAE